jgi:PKD repeat protein
MGQGSLASSTVAPVITKINDTSFSASITSITAATSYQFIVYDTNLDFLYSAVSQTSNSFTYSNVPIGTYVVTIQASNSTGTKVGVSSPITI